MARLNEDALDCMNLIDDVEDCAILTDEEMEKSIMDSNSQDFPDDDEDDLDDEEDEIDIDQDFEDDIVDLNIEGVDGDDIIAAQRDIAYNPFEDDDIIDSAIGDDNSVCIDEED